jgi:hypothetical protein
VTKLNRKGDEAPTVVEPGGRVFLTAEEQTITAQAHRRAEDSPFMPRTITHYNPLTHDPSETFVAPLLEKIEPEAEPAPAVEVKPGAASRPRSRRRAAAGVT